MRAVAHDVQIATPTRPDRAKSAGRAWLARAELAYGVGRALSLDVALAALAGGVMASRVVHITPRPAFYALLPMGVWVAYTLDHLLDARRVGAGAHTPRHRWHYRHAARLWAALVLVSALALPLAWAELSRTGVIFGVALAGLCAAHEAIVKLAGSRASPLLIKELGVALIFTAGTWGLPLMLAERAPVPLGAGVALLALQYLLLALVNLLEFSTYEAAVDARDGHTSFVLAVGPRAAQRTTAGLLAAEVPLGMAAALLHPGLTTWRAEVVFAAMTALLAVVLVYPASLRKRERYRTLGDGAFLLPLLMCWR